MSENMVVKIDMGKICAECGKGGAVPSGVCLACSLKAMKGKPMKSSIGRAVQRRYKEINAKYKKG